MLTIYLCLGVRAADDWRAVVRAAYRLLPLDARRHPAKRTARKLFYRELLDQHDRARRLLDNFHL